MLYKWDRCGSGVYTTLCFEWVIKGILYNEIFNGEKIYKGFYLYIHIGDWDMTQVIDTTLSTEKFFESRLKDMEKKLRGKFRLDEYKIDIRGHIVYKDIIDNITSKPMTTYDHAVVEVYITTRFMEISELCSSYVYSISSKNEDLSEKELDELFDECYEHELEEINTQYTLYNEITYNDQAIVIKTNPLECTGDYCDVGGVIIAKVNYINPYTLDKLESVLYHVIELFLM